MPLRPWLAVSPILLVLVVMAGFGRSAAVAGAAGLALAVGLALGPFALHAAPGLGLGEALLGVTLEGLFLTATVLAIVWPALALHRWQTETGATERIRAALARLAPDAAALSLLVGWFFALFVEGAAGFGTPVALAAPLLAGFGLDPAQAVAVALIGHSVGVSFGAVGTPVLAQAELVSIGERALAGPTALIHGLLGPILAIAAVLRSGAGREGVGRGVALAILAAVLFLTPSVLVAHAIGPELPTLVGALAGGMAFVLVITRFRPPSLASVRLGSALAPYLVLIGLVLVTRLVPPVRAMAEAPVISWRLWGRFGGSVRPLFHPGTLLVMAFFAGGLWRGARVGVLARTLGRTALDLGRVAAALVAMLVLARLMLHAGMITALAEAAIGGIGPFYPLLAPAVGALGSFVTGSATASNILFSALQAATAEGLGLSPVLLLAAQGVGAGVGNIICPHNIVAGAATVGIAGAEGAILRATMLPCLIYLAAAGSVVVFLAS